MNSFDVVIVGAGIVGAACSARLAGEGMSVLLLEANDIATGTTAAGMGHIVIMDDSEPQFALTKFSQDLWNNLSEELPKSCEFEHCGTIWVAADEEEMDEVRRKNAFYSSHGIETEILDRHALHVAEPNMAERLSGGLRVPNDKVVYQLTATKFLIDKGVKRGALLRTGSSVEEINDEGVKLQNGEIVSAGCVVNAAGAAASDLTPQLKIKKRKGHLVITERYNGFVSHQLIELGYLKSAHGKKQDSVAFNVQPRSTGQVLLGSSRQFGAETTDVDNKIVQRMTSRAFEYMPKLRTLAAVRIWTGFRPATPDNLPYIGKIPGFNNVYAAAGHEGLGITTSLGTAALLADEIMKRTPSIPAEPYLPSRTHSEH